MIDPFKYYDIGKIKCFEFFGIKINLSFGRLTEKLFTIPLRLNTPITVISSLDRRIPTL